MQKLVLIFLCAFFSLHAAKKLVFINTTGIEIFLHLDPVIAVCVNNKQRIIKNVTQSIRLPASQEQQVFIIPDYKTMNSLKPGARIPHITFDYTKLATIKVHSELRKSPVIKIADSQAFKIQTNPGELSALEIVSIG